MSASKPRPSLALVIPTYGRAAVLEEGLLKMRDGLVDHGIAVYVSDDSPDTATEDMLVRLSPQLHRVHYRRNRPALGHDRNLVRTLLWPTEDHVWILGDAGWVVPDAFERVLTSLDGQDFLFANSHATETPDSPRLQGDAARALVRDLLWHQTLTGSTIYSRRVLEWLRSTTPQAERLVTNFPHLSVIVDFMAAHGVTVGWLGRRSTRFAPKSSYWQNTALKVWVDDWSAVVRRQPGVILPAECPAVLRSHSARTNLFNAGFLLELRQRGDLNWAYLRDHPDVWHAVHVPAWKLWVIARFPLPWLTAARQWFHRLQ